MHSSYLSQEASARLILEAYQEIDWSRCKRTPSHLRSLGKAILQCRGDTDEGYQSPEDDRDHHGEYDARSTQDGETEWISLGQ
jgi:hypothetical protein